MVVRAERKAGPRVATIHRCGVDTLGEPEKIASIPGHTCEALPSRALGSRSDGRRSDRDQRGIRRGTVGISQGARGIQTARWRVARANGSTPRAARSPSDIRLPPAEHAVVHECRRAASETRRRHRTRRICGGSGEAEAAIIEVR